MTCAGSAQTACSASTGSEITGRNISGVILESSLAIQLGGGGSNSDLCTILRTAFASEIWLGSSRFGTRRPSLAVSRDLSELPSLTLPDMTNAGVEVELL